MRFQIFQQASYEGPGIIADWAVLNDHTAEITRFFEEQYPVPGMDSFDVLVVLGGPMGVYEEREYPWLTEEKRIIEKAIGAGKKVLGICLGAQLVASVLGARVKRNQHMEIGWGPIWLTEEGMETSVFSHIPEELEVLHWHGDTFDIPSGARNLAQSAGCRHQAFDYGDNVLGLQFHLEFTRRSVQALVENCGDDLSEDTHVQPASRILARQSPFMRANHAMRGILLQITSESLRPGED